MQGALEYYEQELFSKTEQPFKKTRNASHLSESINDFTNDLHACVAGDDKNNFVSSGLSAHLIMSMCSLGARKNTLKEMQDVLHLNKTISSDHFKKLILNLNDSNLGVVNRIYIDKSIVVKYPFIRDVTQIFHSDVIDTDFSKVNNVVNAINGWCSEETEGKINEIVTKGDITSDLRLLLINAVYFKASWLHKFPTFGTYKGKFYVDKKTTIEVPTMSNHQALFYKKLAAVDAECIGIPYRDQDFVFVVIKPKKIDGLDYIEKHLDKIDLNYQEDFKDSKNICHCGLDLPKFKIESMLHLNSYFEKLGMTEAFKAGEANFKGISEKPKLIPPLYIGQAVQKAFIEVNEEGTEAAAFTRVHLRGGGGLQIPVIDFKVDRPFLYRIVNVSSNIVLFSGRVTRPMYN